MVIIITCWPSAGATTIRYDITAKCACVWTMMKEIISLGRIRTAGCVGRDNWSPSITFYKYQEIYVCSAFYIWCEKKKKKTPEEMRCWHWHVNHFDMISKHVTMYSRQRRSQCFRRMCFSMCMLWPQQQRNKLCRRPIIYVVKYVSQIMYVYI